MAPASVPGWHFAPLFGQDLVPVASPAYLERYELPGKDDRGKDDRAALESAVLLDHDRKEPHWTDWHVWLAETGFSRH